MKKSLKHVAIIPDGSGRWATRLGHTRLYGHQAGAKVVYDIVVSAQELGIEHLTLFALSCDNLSRPKAEVDNILGLCLAYIQKYLTALDKAGVKIQFIGCREGLSSRLRESLMHAESATVLNEKFVLTIALNFSGSWHVRKVVRELVAQKCLKDQVIDQAFKALLPSEPDILIRTGGEKRLSDFTMYHLRYTELFFLDMMWPDFSSDVLKQVVNQYHCRERRFGQIGVSE